MVIRGKLTGQDLSGHPGGGVRNGFKDNDPSEPTVDEVHGVERNSGDLDDRVVASSKEEQRNHVDDRHDTGTVAELSSGGGIALAEVDLPHAESAVGSEVAQKHEGLKTAGERTDVDGSRELELTVVTCAEERCVQEVLAEGSKESVRCSKVALAIVVQAGQCTEVLGEVEENLVDEKGADKGNPNPTQVVHHVQVLQWCGGVFVMSTTASSGEGLHDGVCSR